MAPVVGWRDIGRVPGGAGPWGCGLVTRACPYRGPVPMGPEVPRVYADIEDDCLACDLGPLIIASVVATHIRSYLQGDGS